MRFATVRRMPYRKKIKALRESVGMSQRQLAAAIGMSPSQLSLIESGKRDLRVGSLFQIAAALGMSIGQFVTGIAPACFALRHNDLVMVNTDEGPRPYAAAESRGRIFLLPMFEGDPLDPSKADIVSVERDGAAKS